MLRAIQKFIAKYTYRPWVLWFTKKDRRYQYDDVTIMVRSGVFHPGLYFSTRLILANLRNADLDGKILLELGCGSGLISVWAAKRGASIVASDINPVAVNNTEENLKANKVADFKPVISDLFQSIQPQSFDYIIVNPPYYPKYPQNMAEKAWFCGVEFEYFHELFKQLLGYMNNKTEVWMSLSDACDLKSISTIATENGFEMETIDSRWTWIENHMLHRISHRQ